MGELGLSPVLRNCEPRGTAGLPRYRQTGENEPRSREEIIEDQEDELCKTQERLRRGARGTQPQSDGMARYQAFLDADDDRIVRMMQQGRGPYQEPRRADALHPHLGSS
eukprot:4672142-Amphidinium_carterae.2